MNKEKIESKYNTVLTIFSKERSWTITNKVVWVSNLGTGSSIQTRSWSTWVSYFV